MANTQVENFPPGKKDGGWKASIAHRVGLNIPWAQRRRPKACEGNWPFPPGEKQERVYG